MNSSTKIFHRLQEQSNRLTQQDDIVKQTFILSNMDALGFIEMNLQNLQITLNKKLAYWEEEKAALLALNAELYENEKEQKCNIKLIFEKIFVEIKGLFQSPECSLKTAFNNIAPSILALEKELSAATDKLSELPKKSDDANVQKEKLKLRFQICNANIAMLNGSIHLITNISREINLRTTLEEVAEKALLLAINLVTILLLHIPVPLNVSFSPIYRKYLYNKIHRDTDQIENFTLKAVNQIDQSNKLIGTFFGKSENVNKRVVNDEKIDELDVTTPSLVGG